MEGRTVTFDLTDWPDDLDSYKAVEHFYMDQIQDLVKKLIEKNLEFSLSKSYPHDTISETWTLTFKSCWNEELAPKKHMKISEAFNICNAEDCYQPVAASQAKGLYTCLHQRHGVDLHPIHERCWHHTNATGKEICRTIETLTETAPGERWWSKIVVWKLRSRWYSQRLEYDNETGDFGTILSEYIKATPWLGPFKERDAAITAARDRDEDEEYEHLVDIAEQAAMQREDETRDRWLCENS